MPNKPIGNIDKLQDLLTIEDTSWQKSVFNQTGLIVLPSPKGQSSWELISSCGIGSLDDDAEYHWVNGRDNTSYCEISNVEQLIKYIKEMDTYQSRLKNICLGLFYKSDLFWAIYARILSLNTYNDYPEESVYGLRAIEGPGSTCVNNSNYPNLLWFDTSVCGCNELPGIVVHLKKNDELSAVVTDVANQIREFREIQDWDDSYPSFSYNPDAPFFVPSSYNEVLSASKLIRY